MSFGIFDWASAPPFQQILDYSGGTQPIYIGWAAPGVATSRAAWKIRKLTYDSNSNVTQIQWAGGDVGFNAVWDNRTTLTYS